MAEPLGYFTFVLHSHLPYVIGHGRWPHGMDWLNEAAAESYIPLLTAFNRLGAEGRHSGVTLGITPILAEMLAARVFRREFKDYLNQKIQAATEDLVTFQASGRRAFRLPGPDVEKPLRGTCGGLSRGFRRGPARAPSSG